MPCSVPVLQFAPPGPIRTCASPQARKYSLLKLLLSTYAEILILTCGSSEETPTLLNSTLARMCSCCWCSSVVCCLQLFYFLSCDCHHPISPHICSSLSPSLISVTLCPAGADCLASPAHFRPSSTAVCLHSLPSNCGFRMPLSALAGALSASCAFSLVNRLSKTLSVSSPVFHHQLFKPVEPPAVVEAQNLTSHRCHQCDRK